MSVDDTPAYSVIDKVRSTLDELAVEIENLEAQRDRAIDILDAWCIHPNSGCKDYDNCVPCRTKHILKGEE